MGERPQNFSPLPTRPEQKADRGAQSPRRRLLQLRAAGGGPRVLARGDPRAPRTLDVRVQAAWCRRAPAHAGVQSPGPPPGTGAEGPSLLLWVASLSHRRTALVATSCLSLLRVCVRVCERLCVCACLRACARGCACLGACARLGARACLCVVSVRECTRGRRHSPRYNDTSRPGSASARRPAS